jgi:hypothetical protein
MCIQCNMLAKTRMTREANGLQLNGHLEVVMNK